MSTILKVWIFIKNYAEQIFKDKIGIYSAQASFFFVLSIFPIILIVLNILSYTSLPADVANQLITQIFPDTFAPLIIQITGEIYKGSSGALLSITGVVAIWSASKAVFALTTGMYNVYTVEDSRPYLIARGVAILHTIVFVLGVVFSLSILVFGNRIYALIKENVPIVARIIAFLFGNKTLISLGILTLFFLFIFKTVRHSGYSLLSLLPGALISACGWIGFSYVFSIYVDNFGNYSYLYGSITSIVIFMLWIYACMFIIFLGAELNVVLHDDLQRALRLSQYRKELRKNA